MDIIGIIITASLSLAGLLGLGSFLALRIMRVSMKLSEDYENKAQIEEMKRQHAAQIADLQGQVNRLAEAVIGANPRPELPARKDGE